MMSVKKLDEMTFEQFYQEVIKQAGVTGLKEYIRSLWDRAYTIEQAVFSVKSLNDSDTGD